MTAQRDIPSVDFLLTLPPATQLVQEYGHSWVVNTLRETLEGIRNSIANGSTLPANSEIMDEVSHLLASQSAISIRKVINATGVLLHTNLGRAPLSSASLESLREVEDSYTNLEFDLETGKRGNRSVHAQDLLTRLLQTEAALVVNNNAAAVLLILSALAKGKKVAISRAQMIEIGGGFRIPEVMRQSGAKLYEIGTTNRTHLSDYQTALDEGSEMILVAHPSNYKIVGFTTQPGLSELSQLAQTYQVPLVYDIGSGAILDTASYGLSHEPMVQEALIEGADLVCFSGDKLLGGPQCGIIVGRKDLIAELSKHPLYRALRPDKLILLTLSATLLSYLKGKADTEIPLYHLLSRSLEDLQKTAQAVVETLGCGSVISGKSTIGGGSLPEETLDTWLVAFPFRSPSKLLKCLRQQTPPVIARIQDDQVVCDLRTVMPEDTGILIENLRKALVIMKE
ncbi:MAG: L-seryl-tRNA(Sec) selenium transferase [Anaerolineaceae bacterium]